MSQDKQLSFQYRNKSVPVTYQSVSKELAEKALISQPFQRWCKNCESSMEEHKTIEIHSVEIQSVDMFGPRVGFVKIKSNCTLVDGQTHHSHPLPGICLLRGDSVAILVALICKEDGKVYSLLVDQPRIPIGQVSILELPAGMIDDTNDSVSGVASKEMEEECGIKIKASELVDLTKLLLVQNDEDKNNDTTSFRVGTGISPSPGGCDEFIRYFYLEKQVTLAQLNHMKGRLAGLRDHGEYISLRVVPMEEMWKISSDAKTMCALLLVDKLRAENRLPPLGSLSTPLNSSPNSTTEPLLQLAIPNNDTTTTTTTTTTNNNTTFIPQLAFGLYKVPATEEGVQIVLAAIAAGYRHFDCASIYGNEKQVGQAIQKSGIDRSEFFICSKVWNDAQKQGRAAVRQSVESSLEDLKCDYFDLYYVHWPVPGHMIETYKELELLYKEGKIKNIGISNFTIEDYEKLLGKNNIEIPPVVNQFEVSPFMYRPNIIKYFQDKHIIVAASKAMHRASQLDNEIVKKVAQKHSITPAQAVLRWGLQKRLIVVVKTSKSERMYENRSITTVSLTEDDILCLDKLTTEVDVRKREELEMERKNSL